MEETSWVRTAYLYVMCVVSFLLVAFGGLAAVTGLVHTVAPDLGHRDTLDRVGIGVSNIAANVVDLVNETQGGGNSAEFCRDVTDTESDFEDCMGSGSIDADGMSAIQDGIGEVKGELQRQIRNNSIDQLIKGLLLIGLGIVVFRVHGHRTQLFANGLVPPRAPVPTPDPAPPTPPATPPSTIPPPPGA